jgi:hypothetical protein
MKIKNEVGILFLIFQLLFSFSCTESSKTDSTEKKKGDFILLEELYNQGVFSLGWNKLSEEEEVDIDNFPIKNIESTAYVNKSYRAIIISLKNTRTKNITIEKYSKLKRIEMKLCYINNIRISNLPELILIRLWAILNFNEKGDLKIDIFNLPKLKMLKLEGLCFSNGGLILNLHNLPELESIIIDVTNDLPYYNLSNFPKLRKLKLNECGIKTLSLSELPSLTFFDVQKNERLEEVDLSDIDTLEKLILPDLEKCKLQEVRLNKDNKAWPGIVRAYYGRDKLGRIVSENYFDVNRKYCNHPIYGYAKKEYEYRYSPKMFFEKKKTMKYTAKELDARRSVN